MSFVFVSHASPDKPKIKPIIDSLIAAGIRVWLDDPVAMGYRDEQIQSSFRRIRAGGRWRDEIDEALRQADAVLVCWSEHVIDTHRTVWMSEAAFARVANKLVACRIDDIDLAQLPDHHSAEQVVDLRPLCGSADAGDEQAAQRLTLLISDIQRLLSRGSIAPVVSSPVASRNAPATKMSAHSPIFSQEDKDWLRDIYVREVGSMLRAWSQGLDTRGQSQLYTGAARNPIFVTLFGSVRAEPYQHTHRLAARRIADLDIGSARRVIQERGGLDLVISPAHAGTLALLTYLRDVCNIPIRLRSDRAHSVEILDLASRSLLEADGFTLTIATFGAFLRQGSKTFVPAMAMPGMSHGILAANPKSTLESSGEFLLMKDVPSSEYLLARTLIELGRAKSSVVAEAEPDEATRALSTGDRTVRAIIGFPHYEFNLRYNRCILLPASTRNPLPAREVFLFLGRSVVIDAPLSDAITLCLRYAWHRLLMRETDLVATVDAMLSDDTYLETLVKITGIQTIRETQASTDAWIDDALGPASQHPGYAIRRCTADEIIPLRKEVLRSDGPVDDVLFDQDDDAGTRHYCAELATGEIIGCVSMLDSLWNGSDAWQLRAMAVDRKHQGQGIGGALVDFMLCDLAPEAAIRPIWCNARENSAGFYRRKGWRNASPTFLNGRAGPSIRMVREPENATGSQSATYYPFS